MSDEDDFFKRFFFRGNSGFPFSSFPPTNQPPNHTIDGHEEFDSMHSFIFHDMNRMFHEMDQMMKQFTIGGASFGGFGSLPPNHFNFGQEVPAIENSPPTNKRDEFLKPKDDKSIIVPSNKPKSFFDNFFESIPFNYHDPAFNKKTNGDKFYEDLDEKIAKEGLDKVLREDVLKQNDSNKNSSSMHEFKNQQQPSIFSSFGQSYSVRRIQRPDGSVEEIKTIRNSDGNEEKTITRLIGDKKHSIIEKKANNVIKETEEIFENFDEKNLEDFNRMWNYNSNNKNNQYKNPVIESFIPGSSSSNNDARINSGVSSDSKSITSSPPSILSKIYSWFR